MSRSLWCRFFALAVLLVPITSCNRNVEPPLQIDGSSTVFPIIEAVAEEFARANADARVTVGVSGTGGGFKKFCAGEIDIVSASRVIAKNEVALCSAAAVAFVELPVAYDALTVVVNPENDWTQSISLEELRRIWEPAAQGKVMKWSDVRPNWPDAPLRLFGPGVDSGSYDYFTEVVVGKAHSSRGDFTSSEDDNVIVQGISGDRFALGYFGLAYFQANENRVKALAVDDGIPENGIGPQEPTIANVLEGSYQPLSRPLFVYIREASLNRPQVAAFARFLLEQSGVLAEEVGYVRLPPALQVVAEERLRSRIVGSQPLGDIGSATTLSPTTSDEARG